MATLRDHCKTSANSHRKEDRSKNYIILLWSMLSSSCNHIKHARLHVFDISPPAQWPGLWMAARLRVTLFWYRPHCSCCVNQIVLMLTRCVLMTKLRWLFQSKVTSSFAAIQRPTGHRTENCKMVFWPRLIYQYSNGFFLSHNSQRRLGYKENTTYQIKKFLLNAS